MKNEINRAQDGQRKTFFPLVAEKTEQEETSWTKVLFEIIIKILTLGFYHIEKHAKK